MSVLIMTFSIYLLERSTMATYRYGRISHRQDVYNLRLKNGNNIKLSESYKGDTRLRSN